jgi:hypothetical protein
MKNQTNTTELLLGAAALAAVAYGGKKLYDKLQHNGATQNVDTDTNANIAQQLQTAINTSFTRSIVGSDDATILTLVKQATSWDAVAKAYKQLTKRNVVDDMRKGMSSAGFQTVLNIIGQASGAIKPKQAQTKAATTVVGIGSYAIATRDAPLRKSPMVKGTGYIRNPLTSNLVTMAKAGQIIGIVSVDNLNKTFYDPAINVYFIAVKVQNGVNAGNIMYVASSNIQTTKDKTKLAGKQHVKVSNNEFNLTAS